MKFLAPCLAALAIVGAAVALASYRADHPPEQVPAAPNRIVQIADWHWTPDDECSPDDRGDYLELVEQIQQQQMEAIRALDVREVWIEGQSDQTIADFRQHVLKLRGFEPPEGDSPVDQLIRDTHHEDLLQIGDAGRLLVAGEIDEVLPLEDHAAWQAANPVNGEIDNDTREHAMAKRLPKRAVIVLGMDHELWRWLPAGAGYRVVRVDALPDLRTGQLRQNRARK